MERNHYENFPAGIVLLSNAVSISIYVLGFIILLRLGILIGLLYLLYVFILEFRLIKFSCINCYYYGNICGFGRGKISALYFRKGESSEFCSKEISWVTMIPDFLLVLIPLISGIVMISVSFDIYLMIYIILLGVLTTIVNGYIRGKLTCAFCRQRELGCPAEKLFNKNQNLQ